MQIINRRYHKDAVNQMILKAAPSFGDESAEGRLSFSIGLKSHAGQGELEEAISGTSPKRSLPVLLLESADDSSGYGDEEMADYESPFYFQSKKRRLSAEQVRLLEMSFEEENKLEPERKLQLAKEVGLLPRQVAIWFQNRRARWKTKQLERDYDVLKAAYDSLLSDKAKLQDEIALLHVKLESSPQETSPEENSHVMNREDHPDYLSSIQPTPNLEDLPLKTAGSPLFLSDFFMLKKPSSTSEGQQLHSPISSNDAFFDSSSYASFLIDTSQQRILDLKVGSSCAVDLVGFDQKPTSAMPQSARLHGGAGDPAHYLLLKQGVLGSVVSPQYSRQHMIELKQEADGFEAEDCCTTTFSFPLEESGGWPWFWEG